MRSNPVERAVRAIGFANDVRRRTDWL